MDDESNRESNTHNNKTTTLSYMLKDESRGKIAIRDNGKMKCPFCKIIVKNILIHFTRKIGCGEKIYLDNFLTIYEDFDEQRKRAKNREKTNKYNNKKRHENTEDFLNQNAKAAEKYKNRKKQENKDEFLKQNAKEVEKYQRGKKQNDLKAFKEDHNAAKKKYLMNVKD